MLTARYSWWDARVDCHHHSYIDFHFILQVASPLYHNTVGIKPRHQLCQCWIFNKRKCWKKNNVHIFKLNKVWLRKKHFKEKKMSQNRNSAGPQRVKIWLCWRHDIGPHWPSSFPTLVIFDDLLTVTLSCICKGRKGSQSSSHLFHWCLSSIILNIVGCFSYRFFLDWIDALIDDHGADVYRHHA